jgi:hypothetical protein
LKPTRTSAKSVIGHDLEKPAYGFEKPH